ncbi:MAG: hypothetical protein HQM12_04540 [SAR324 cluster bacterium]|nr:hypothetical protein [SAR324 cluster bacterium]
MKKQEMHIYGNPIDSKTVKKANRQKQLFSKIFRYNPDISYSLSSTPTVLSDMLGIQQVEIGNHGSPIDMERGVLLGTIRMGYGHYRIAMAIASVAQSRGLVPYWFDLLSFEKTAGARIINMLNQLYSLGSRLSQKIEPFNKYYWEPLNYEGFKKLSYNAADLHMTQLMNSIYKTLPNQMPVVACHAWAAQSALAAGMKHVVNVVPDNWPMGLHLAEGSIHAVQSESAYLGYRLLREMGADNQPLKPMPESDIQMTGHYVDHELVSNLDHDCDQRLDRISNRQERRLLFSIGGAGAQMDTVVEIIRYLKPAIEQKKVAILLNMGDHDAVWSEFQKAFPEESRSAHQVFDNLEKVREFLDMAQTEKLQGIYLFKNKDIFSAVYTTNLLMRISDLLITKPSELAFYPIPKLFIKRVGGHEKWGAIRGAEIGDSTIECDSNALLFPTLDLLIQEDGLLQRYVHNIKKLKQAGVYEGAYKVLDLACSH